ncbi:intercellular adhesion molecule 1-like isoform X2 [Sphaeramia orbicularis]|uniref:intercellular adhesion molecule 1-like isoform X2 n=1 Tax=Sphaeramia orbicularis TaxID=375764 RepID=UPI00117E3365|nr:intercellular adhesion molecule 1-like isoform X2 [Sphaeramia orbicularis]
MSPCVFLFLICVNSLGVSHVRSSDDPEANTCEDPPVFSPSHLVVKHGDPTTATCTVCKEKCHNKHMGLEKPLGTDSMNGTTITWTVDKMTEWDTFVMCYYNTESRQCSSSLPITVYQPPVRVSFNFVNHSGPMILGHTYIMQCSVEDVAPVGGLTVVFYKGETELNETKLDGEEKNPVTIAVLFQYHPVRGYHNWNYYCKATLQLGTEHFSWKSSEEVNIDTYFPPQLDVPPYPNPINVTEGDALVLNCSAYGSPRTHYRWKLPTGQTIAGNSIFTLDPVSVSDEGHYICSASNNLGTDTVDYSVFVQRDHNNYSHNNTKGFGHHQHRRHHQKH